VATNTTAPYPSSTKRSSQRRRTDGVVSARCARSLHFTHTNTLAESSFPLSLSLHCPLSHLKTS
jgi:hypothetical protein